MWEHRFRALAVLPLRRPVLTLTTLLGFVLAVELARRTPEIVPGGAAVGEVARNVAYALIGATIFHQLIVELPARRRRRRTYDFHRQTLHALLVAGPGLLDQYQTAAKMLDYELDVWKQDDLMRFADDLEARGQALIAQGHDPRKTTFGPVRADQLKFVVDVAVPRALSDLSASAAYLDDEVAHAISQFPRQDGLSMLQVTVNERGCVAASHDVSIVWTLLQAARRLYDAGLDVGAFSRDILQPVPAIHGVDGASEDVLLKRM